MSVVMQKKQPPQGHGPAVGQAHVTEEKHQNGQLADSASKQFEVVVEQAGKGPQDHAVWFTGSRKMSDGNYGSLGYEAGVFVPCTKEAVPDTFGKAVKLVDNWLSKLVDQTFDPDHPEA
jgi:hypothetical protein